MSAQKTGKHNLKGFAFPKKNILLILLVSGAGLALFFSSQIFQERSSQASAEQKQIRVLTVAAMPVVVQQSYSTVRTYLGKVETRRSSQLGFELGGMLATMNVEEGEAVNKGQLLASLDTERLEAAKREAEAQLAETGATLQLARATLKRTQQAQRLKAVSVQQLEEAQSNLRRQQASMVRIQAQIDRIKVDLQKAKLYAPYTGTVASRMSDEGTVISAGQPVYEILETGNVEIRIGLDRDISSTLQPKDMLQGSFAKESFPLEITRILPGRASVTRVVQVIASPSASDITLREGDIIEVELRTRINQDGFWLPVSALTENARGVWSALVVEPLDDKTTGQGATHYLKRKDLEIISLEEERVFVTGNFQGGDQVVANGLHRVVPNQRVRLAESENQGDSHIAWNR